MNNEILRDIYNVFLDRDIQLDSRVSLLTVNEPIFEVISYLDKIYTVYVMQNRTLIKNNQLIDIQECLITLPAISDFTKLIDGEISIYSFLAKSDNYRIGKIGNKIFPYVKVSEISEIRQKIPSNETFLNLNDQVKLECQTLICNKIID